MKKIISVLSSLAVLIALALPCFALNMPAYVPHNFTVLWSDAKDDGLSLILHGKDLGVCEAFLDYDGDYEISVDETEPAEGAAPINTVKKGYDAFINHQRIEAGTVISIYHSDVAESYPAQIKDISEVGFPYHRTDMTADEAEELLDGLTEFNGEKKFVIDDSERLNFPVRKEYTLLSSKFDENSGEYSTLFSDYTVYYSVADDSTKKIYLTFDKRAAGIEFSSDGTDRGNAALEAYNNREPIPAGTVCELLTGSTVMETYPPQLEVYAVKFTYKPTWYTLEEAVSEIENINEFFATGRDFPVPTSLSDNDGVPSYGGFPASIAYNGEVYKFAPELGNVEMPQGGEMEAEGSAIYVEGMPSESGTQNFSEAPVSFATANINGKDGLVAVIFGEWRFFKNINDIEDTTPPEEKPEEQITVPNPGLTVTEDGEDGDLTDTQPDELNVPLINDIDGDSNPPTGNIFPALALAGVILWTGCARKSIKK